ncbi:hypothetical protein [Actinomadura madurae]|uniref:hypothetical protein n=1 Tax=Actinomadura madurae TaxID=1993 RepID=UPI0020D24E67|nr:hypothetical protein [Actinomadura madurae]MCQ0012096.1 hypothetical protein [Actinomadura madurae]
MLIGAVHEVTAVQEIAAAVTAGSVEPAAAAAAEVAADVAADAAAWTSRSMASAARPPPAPGIANRPTARTRLRWRRGRSARYAAMTS